MRLFRRIDTHKKDRYLSHFTLRQSFSNETRFHKEDGDKALAMIV